MNTSTPASTPTSILRRVAGLARPGRTTTGVLAATVTVAVLMGSAGPASAAGLTQAAVRKIAAGVVAAAAPTLAVARAQTADTAAQAGTADRLADQAPSAYQNRASQFLLPTSGPTDLAFFNPTEIGSTTLVVPDGVGFVHLTATLSLVGEPGASDLLWVAQDADSCAQHTGTGFTNHVEVSLSPAGRTQAVSDIVLAATTGAHTYRMCAVAESSGTGYNQGSLTVETVAVAGT